MKICVISDIHGSTRWKDIVRRERRGVDRFVFLGDYFDSKSANVLSQDQDDNFADILEFREEFGRVDLLAGNHDLQYVGGARTNQYSLLTRILAGDTLMELIREGTLLACAAYDGYLFSHAGVGGVWMDEHGFGEIADINKAFRSRPLVADFVERPGSSSKGDDPYQGPLWIRPDSLFETALPDYDQVVGHTRIKEVTAVAKGDRRLVFMDTGLREYVVLDTGRAIEHLEIRKV
ncbi:MAG: metallophosphoesterase [Mediterranea sp.]|jgi:hypothetical protein|nr:metallophosphoesterase [Mediterranea sp.]